MPGGDVCNELIGRDGHVCLVRQGHQASARRLTMKRYAQLDHMTFDMPENYGQTTIDRIVHAQGHERRSALSFHSYFQVPAILNASDYVCTLPTRLAEHFAALHSLEMLTLPFDIDMPLYLTWSNAQNRDPGHRWLRDQIIRAGKNLLGGNARSHA